MLAASGAKGAVAGAAVVVVGGLLFACARPAPAEVPQLQLRAAFDLGCPPQEVQILHFDRRTKGVVGCGRRLTYVASCDQAYGNGACTWVLDSPNVLSGVAEPVSPAAAGGRYPPPAAPVWPQAVAHGAPSPAVPAPAGSSTAPAPSWSSAAPASAGANAVPAPAGSSAAPYAPREADFGF